jgi:peptidyl-prolyl cis-trans isomerase A (cyclophilin A)
VKTIPVLLLLAAAASAQKPPAPLPAGLYATFNTSQGTIVATLYEKYTPESVKNFVGLAQGTKAWRDPKTNAMVKRLAVANSGAPDSGACQFFITSDLSPEWNQKYTIFGQVVRGQDVVDAISNAPLHGDKPVEPAKLLSVTIERIEKNKH